MSQKTITVHCKQCGHTWSPALRLPMLVVRAVRVMDGIAAAGCPKCGAADENVLCGPAPKLPEVPPNREIREGDLP